MALDLSGRTDDEIRLAYNNLQRRPELFQDNPEYLMALDNEYNRRFRSSDPKPANVEDNLAAAAAPLTPDPAVKSGAPRDKVGLNALAMPRAPRGFASMSDEEVLAPLSDDAPAGGGYGVMARDLPEYGQRYREALRNQTAAWLKEIKDRGAPSQAMGVAQNMDPISAHGDAPGGEWSAEPFGPARLRGEGVPAWAQGAFGAGSTVVDGVRVPTFDMGDGQMQYSLGDIKRAQEAEAEAQRLAIVREAVRRDKEEYGTGQPLMTLTPAQVQNRVERQDSERRLRESPAYMRSSARRYAEKTGVPFSEALALLEADAKRNQDEVAKGEGADWASINAIGDGRRKLAAASEQASIDNRAAAQKRVSDMARLAGGSHNLNAGNRAFFQALTMLEGQDPAKLDAQQQVLMQMMPMDRNRAAVEAQNAANAGDVIRRFFTSGAGNMLDPGMAAAAAEERDRKVRNEAYDFAVAERNKVHWQDDAPMSRDLANRIRRRVAAKFGERYASIVDALPVEDSPPVAPAG